MRFQPAPSTPFPQNDLMDSIVYRRYDRDIFCELLSFKEPQTTLQNKETDVQSYQKMSNQNTKNSLRIEFVFYNCTEDMAMDNFGYLNSSHYVIFIL